VTTHEPISIQVGTGARSRWYALGGSPADCARVALTTLAPEVEWVLSGINRGGNLGADTYISGTVAAAREAALLGRRAIALSQYVRKDIALDWEWTLGQARRILSRLLRLPPDPGAFWNVNFPHLGPGDPDPEIVFCGLDRGPLDVRYRIEEEDGVPALAQFEGDYHGRQRDPGRDVEVCFGGRIAITAIPLELTPP
jgi:5'-nucleotidase